MLINELFKTVKVFIDNSIELPNGFRIEINLGKILLHIFCFNWKEKNKLDLTQSLHQIKNNIYKLESHKKYTLIWCHERRTVLNKLNTNIAKES